MRIRRDGAARPYPERNTEPSSRPGCRASPKQHLLGCGEVLVPRYHPRMQTTVTPAKLGEEPVLRNLAQLYAYDFAEIMGWDIPDSGRFPDAIVDGCFGNTSRCPFFLRAGDHLAGFAIVDMRSRLTGDESVHDMAEFFVARTSRRRGVGAAAAVALFDRFPGRWEVRQADRNTAALAFWRAIIGRNTAGRFDEVRHDGPGWRGTVQSFDWP